MSKKKKFKMEDWADMVFGNLIYHKRRERITDERPIPKIIEQEVKTGVWNGGTTNKKKKEEKK